MSESCWEEDRDVEVLGMWTEGRDGQEMCSDRFCD